MHRFIETAQDGPRASGAYALLIALDEPLRVHAGARDATLAPGLYVYCGSARGPGGLAARLARHMRRDKRAHWHVDQLTGSREGRRRLGLPRPRRVRGQRRSGGLADADRGIRQLGLPALPGSFAFLGAGRASAATMGRSAAAPGDALNGAGRNGAATGARENLDFTANVN